MSKKKEALPIKELLQAYMKQSPLEGQMQAMEFQEVWKQLFGPGIAGQCSGFTIQNRKLFVKVASAVVKTEIGYIKEALTPRVKELMGKDLFDEIILL